MGTIARTARDVRTWAGVLVLLGSLHLLVDNLSSSPLLVGLLTLPAVGFAAYFLVIVYREVDEGGPVTWRDLGEGSDDESKTVFGTDPLPERERSLLRFQGALRVYGSLLLIGLVVQLGPASELPVDPWLITGGCVAAFAVLTYRSVYRAWPVPW